MKKLMIVSALIVMAFAAASCSDKEIKKDEQPVAAIAAPAPAAPASDSLSLGASSSGRGL